jgi:hypothetical protein
MFSGITLPSPPTYTILLAGTTQGTLYLLKESEQIEGNGVRKLDIMFSFTAHKPVNGPQDMNFGSIGLFAEIWSLTWYIPNIHLTLIRIFCSFQNGLGHHVTLTLLLHQKTKERAYGT